ncbi:MAG: CRISPR-associated ring nuclease Crn3/Csx3 [candidate division WOR-3 bacterium]
MEKITFKTTKKGQYALVEFVCDGELEPSILANLNPPDPIKEDIADKIVILSGRGPIWLYAFLTHYYHPCSAIAIFDPRLNGAVLTQKHSTKIRFSIGDIIPKNEFLESNE